MVFEGLYFPPCGSSLRFKTQSQQHHRCDIHRHAKLLVGLTLRGTQRSPVLKYLRMCFEKALIDHSKQGFYLITTLTRTHLTDGDWVPTNRGWINSIPLWLIQTHEILDCHANNSFRPVSFGATQQYLEPFPFIKASRENLARLSTCMYKQDSLVLEFT